jgi:predicted Rdx family selenoprotein
MNVTFLKWGAGSLALLVSAAGVTTVFAQDPSSSQASPAATPAAATPATGTEKKADPSIAQRKENQQDRIANGVKSGQLTAGETANLEKKEAAINKETSADRAANGGKLTSAEKAQVNKQQNQVSKQIYADKHNANTAHYGNNKVGQRRENQQDRIAQGIKSGQLTPSETAKLEKQQQGINKQVATDRKANGGTLNAAQKKQINKDQNQASRNIYHKKHNAATQGSAKPKQ